MRNTLSNNVSPRPRRKRGASVASGSETTPAAGEKRRHRRSREEKVSKSVGLKSRSGTPTTRSARKETRMEREERRNSNEVAETGNPRGRKKRRTRSSGRGMSASNEKSSDGRESSAERMIPPSPRQVSKKSHSRKGYVRAQRGEEEVYETPAEATVPKQFEVSGREKEEDVQIPSDTIPDLLASYAFLRSFAWQIRLSPFPFEEFARAMASHTSNTLMDEIHICVLRALAVDEVPVERAERRLDLAMLDSMTWPCYVWEVLHLYRDRLAASEWKERHRVNEQTESIRGSARGARQDVGAMEVRQVDLLREKQYRRSVSEPVERGDLDNVSGKCTVATTIASAIDIDAGGDAQQESTRVETISRTKPTHAFEPIDEAVMDAASTEDAATDPRTVFNSDVTMAPRRRCEYVALPVGIKAKILARMCDYLLDCTTIRAEVTRRELNNEFVTGKEGEGSVFAMMTLEEKKLADACAAEAHRSDSNTDICVLCAQGGSLLCCDSCPAAYHLRCLGETGKTVGDGHWRCPECSVGGRGELAGLRLPIAARNEWDQPYFLMNGDVIRVQRPTVKGTGEDCEELDETTCMTVYSGQVAQEHLELASKVSSGVENAALPSSYELVYTSDSESKKGSDVPESVGDPDEYINRYKNSWPAALGIIQKVIEDCKKKKQKAENWIPTGTCGRVKVERLPVPMPISRFAWGQLLGRPPVRTTSRCGTCRTCLRPSRKKGCLNPIVWNYGLFSDGPDQGSSPLESMKLSYLLAYILKVEKEFWPLAEGPWGSENGKGLQFRAEWSARLRASSSVIDLANGLSILEASLRPVAFNSDWFGLVTDEGIEHDDEDGLSRNASRAVSFSDLTTALISRHPHNDAANEIRTSDSDKATDVNALHPIDDAKDDPYSVRSEKIVRSGWEVNLRHQSYKTAGVNRLPIELVRKAARQAGRRPIPGVRWHRGFWWPIAPRLEWIAEAEAAETIPQLAMVIRKLDMVLNWDVTVKPKGDKGNMGIIARRPLGDGREFEYLVVEPESEIAGGGGRRASDLNSEQQQRQLLLLLQHVKLAQGHASLDLLRNVHESVKPVPRDHHDHHRQHQQSQTLIPEMQEPMTSEMTAHASSDPDISGLENGKEMRMSTRIECKSDVDEDEAARGPSSALDGSRDARSQVLEKENSAPPSYNTTSVSFKNDDTLNNSNKGNHSTAAEDTDAHSNLQSIPLTSGLGVLTPWGLLQKSSVCVENIKSASMIQHAGMQYTWKHEKEIPLYHIRKYEEVVRRESAERAARELQPPSRTRYMGQQASNSRPSSAIPSTQQKQRDSNCCGICYAIHRDTESANDTWICCDTCNRWFHGVCVGLSPECIDSMSKDQEWTCWGCNAWKKRLARREGPDAVESLLVVHSPTPGVKRTGRPPKPFFERAEYKALESRVLREITGDFKRDGVSPTPTYEDDGFEIVRSERLRQKRESDRKILLGMEVSFDHAANGVKRRSEDEEHAKEGLMMSNQANNDNTSAKVKEKTPLNQASAPRLSTTWREASLKVLARTSKISAATDFRHPVTPDIAPDYLDVVMYPMDLGTLRKQLSSSQLNSPLEVIEGIKLIVENCVLYNGEKSEYTESANEMKHAFFKYWKEAGLPTTAEEWRSIQAAAQPCEDDDGGGLERQRGRHASSREGDVDAKRSTSPAYQNSKMFRAALQALSPSPGARHTQNWRAMAERALSEVLQMVAARHFLEPVPKDFMNYHSVIKHPMDLGTIYVRLRQGYYTYPSQMAKDVALVWTNCRTFNEPDAPVVVDAATCEAKFVRCWMESGIFVNNRLSEAAIQAMQSGSWHENRKSGPTWRDAASKVMYRMHNFVNSAVWFVKPVTEKEAPDYHRVISRPMDLGTVSRKLREGVYRSPAEMLDDVELIWQNARQYNGPGHEVTKAAESSALAFAKVWTNAGLPGLEEEAAGVKNWRGHVVVDGNAWNEIGQDSQFDKRTNDGTGREGSERQARSIAEFVGLSSSSKSAFAPIGSAQERGVLPSVPSSGRHLRSAQAWSRSHPPPMSHADQWEDDDRTTQYHMTHNRTHTPAGMPASFNGHGLQHPGQWETSWHVAAKNIVETLLQHPASYPFREPVVDALAPGYSGKIVRPMDLGVIRWKLGRGEYLNPSSLYDDLSLVFSNCKLYFPQGSAQRTMGAELEMAFLQAWESCGLPSVARY